MNATDLQKYLCITCLKTTGDIHPMSNKLKNEYFMLIEDVKEDIDMLICNICQWLFRKMLRFKQQCKTARNLLTDTLQMDLKPHLMQLSIYPNIKQTLPEVYTFPKTSSFYWDCKNEICNSPKVNNSENNSPNPNCTDSNSPNRNGTESISQEHNIVVDNSPAYINDDGDAIEVEFNVDDEIPLVLLSKSSRGDKKRSLKRKFQKEKKQDIKLELEAQNVSKKSTKMAKVLKDGFSSRMVQETDEYVVIKLTKEQVLQEMSERSKSEAYMQSPYKCEDCVKGFNFQDVLSTHREKHSLDNGTFKCEMCSQYCRSAVSLRGHVKSHTTRYKCKLCPCVRLSRQHLLEHHAITHTRQPVTYTCNACPFNTDKRTVMQRHVKSHAASEPHACEQCGKLFKSIDSLRVHTMRHNKSSRLVCSACGAGFVHRALLRRHIAAAHQASQHYCVECDLHYNSSESLRLHFKKAKRHRDSSAYKHSCQHCPLRFFSAASLSAHAASAHGAHRAHACALCRRVYASRDALRAHAWRVHRPDRQSKES